MKYSKQSLTLKSEQQMAFIAMRKMPSQLAHAVHTKGTSVLDSDGVEIIAIDSAQTSYVKFVDSLGKIVLYYDPADSEASLWAMLADGEADADSQASNIHSFHSAVKQPIYIAYKTFDIVADSPYELTFVDKDTFTPDRVPTPGTAILSDIGVS